MSGETIREQYLAFLIKNQSADGEALNLVTADAIAVETEGLTITIGNRLIESTEATGSLDTGAPLPTGAPSTIRFRARLRGAGQAYTGSVRPPLHPALRSCGMKDKLIASVAAAALSAGTATTATLGASGPATAQALRGAPLQITASGTAARVGATPFVTDYTAGKVATLTDSYNPVLAGTDSVQVPACVVYEPVSERADIPASNVWIYRDGLLYKFKDLRGTGTIAAQSGNPGTFDCTLTGTFISVTDAPIPAGVAPVDIAAPNFSQEARISEAFLVDRKPLPIASYEWQLGVNIQSAEDPNTQFGFGAGQAVSRDMRVTADPLMTLIANRDMITAIQSGSRFTGVVRLGSVANNRIAFVHPALQPVERSEGSRAGQVTEQLQFKAVGANAGGFICFW